ncbi:hypothetical protein DB30_05180 [Enhygromyxa salina]|uniref:Uncharacterized protein n=1 Tax=Enhygromyxa salina TaxID=215803 RepID=A0A0C1ZXJ8_9BACT|nr:MXAN_5187 C-terminal domain-containing protein [Enhygromyxa salina]KIG15873.1 hypothetical protein DB30_05180 [Enhygromyxa salina]
MARAEKAEAARLTMDILDDLEAEIEMLKVAYERYFNGVDRIPPRREHDAVKLHLRNIERMRGGVTALRFRTQTLKARVVTYEHYWTRILRQIEQGTFKRLLAVSARREYEAQRRRAEEDGSAAAQSGVRTIVDPAQSGVRPKVERDASKSGVRPKVDRGAATARGAASRHLPDGVDAREARDLFKQFVAAKKAAGESVSGLTYGRLIDKLAREVPKLQKKHGDEIRFEVDTSGGKVRLRARKRRSDQKAS